MFPFLSGALLIFSIIVSDFTFFTSREPGPLLYISFNKEIKDNSGLNNPVLVSGCRLTSDRKGNNNMAGSFDGIDDYIEIKDISGKLDFSEYSVSCWFYTTSRGLQNIFGKENFETAEGASAQIFINWVNYPGVGFNVVSGKDACYETQYLSSSYVNTGTSIEPGKWHFLVANYNGNRQSLYLDGRLVASKKSGFGKTRMCSTPIRLGIWYEMSIPFKGKMDEFRMYNRVLSAKQISKLYQK